MQNIKKFNQRLLTLVENAGLLVIAIATVAALVSEILSMVHALEVTLTDLLLLFLFLEVLAMVGLYYQFGKLPVRFPLYIAIVALARYLILDMKAMDGWRMLAVFLIRYGHVKFPYSGDEEPGRRFADQSRD